MSTQDRYRSGTGQVKFLAGVLFTCMCGLMLQIMETRVLSVVGYYHLAFFAIGIAMLGMTAGALYVFYAFGDSPWSERIPNAMGKAMTAFAWSVLISLVILINLSVPASFEPTLRFLVAWALTILILVPPYVFLGISISLALTRSPYRVGLVYGVDLAGAALGCLATLALLSLTDTYTAILLVGVIGALAGRLFSDVARQHPVPAAGERGTSPPAAGRVLERPTLALVTVLLLAGLNQLLGTHGLRPNVVKDTVESAYRLTEERWNSFSRIAMSMRPRSEAFLWSPSPIAPKVSIDQGWLNIDGEAGTPIYHFSGDPQEIDFLRFDATALAYYIRHGGRAAIIGIGGGRDLLTASLFGFKDITGVEYNPIFVRLFSRDYREFSGADRVIGLRLFTDDARSWFARSQEHFDLVQMSLIDTWAATGAGAFTLSENGLYTVNGWKRFIARLTPNGVFTVSRWFAPERPGETGRVLSLAVATLTELGVAKPDEHLYLAANGHLSTLIVGRSPLTVQDVGELDSTVRRLGYTTLVAPGRVSADPVFDRILHARSTRELVRMGRDGTVNLAPTWDDNPFFFNQLRLSNPVSMLRLAASPKRGVVSGNVAATLTLLSLVILSGIIVVAVLLVPGSRALRYERPASVVWSSLYFLAIGIGFMFVEISLIQRMSLYLGHPVYGLAVVLFGLIASTGLGSLLSHRAMTRATRTLILWPLVLAAYLATMPLWLAHVLDVTEPGSILQRCAVCLSVIVPAGVVMGFMFPTGIRLCGEIDPRPTPWLWALNGAAGVLASGAAVLISIESSLNVALWIGASCYGLLPVFATGVVRWSQARAPVSQPASA